MDYEDYLSEIYTLIKGIWFLSEIIYEKANNDWNFLESDTNRESFEELIALNYLIGLSAKELLNLRKIQINNIQY